MFCYFGGPESPQKPLRGPESTPGAQKRSPRAIPNDSRVGQKSAKHKNRVEMTGTLSSPCGGQLPAQTSHAQMGH